MNLEQLKALKNVLSERRMADVSSWIEQGFLAILQAKGSQAQSQQKQALLAAVEAFENALQQDAHNPQIYLGFGYIYSLIGQFGPAFNYLYQAQKLAPQDPDIQRLLHYLENRRSLETQYQAQKSQALLELDDLDSLKHALEQAQQTLQAHLQDLPVSANPSDLRKHQQVLLAYQNRQADISQRFEDFEITFEMAEFQHKRLAFEQALGQLKQVIQQSSDLSEIQQNLKQLLLEVKHWIGNLQTQRCSGQQVPLEDILDRCDRFADQLDALEAKGLSLQGLELEYGQLIQWVEVLQDLLQD